MPSGRISFMPELEESKSKPEDWACSCSQDHDRKGEAELRSGVAQG
jgi:hypothetical protein